MSFKDHDKKTFIADTGARLRRAPHLQARLPEEDRPGRRRLLGLLAGLLGNTRGFRGDLGLIGTEAMAQDASRHPVAEGRGLARSRAPRSATPRKQRLRPSCSTRSRRNSPTRPASKSKSRSCRSSRFSPRRRRTCRASSAPTTSTISTSPGLRPSRRTRSIPSQYYKDKPDLAMPGFDWDDFSKPLVDGLAVYEGKWVGIPFDIPIFMLMYRQDILEKHGIAVPTTHGGIHRRDQEDHRSGEGQRHVRHRPPGQVGSLFAELRLDPDGVERRRLDLRRRQEVQGQRRSRRRAASRCTRSG